MEMMCPLVAIPRMDDEIGFYPLKLDIPNQDRLYLKPLDLGNGLDFKSTDGLAGVLSLLSKLYRPHHLRFDATRPLQLSERIVKFQLLCQFKCPPCSQPIEQNMDTVSSS